MASEAARLYVVVDANTTGLTRGLARAQGQLTGFDRKASGTASRLSSGLKTAAKVGGVGLAVGLAYAVKSAASFEKQMSSLGAVTGASTKQMERLRKQALKAGADTAFSAKEAAVAQTELAKGGLSVQQIMSGGLKSALALAAAGELDLGEAAETTANAMKMFGIEGSKSQRVADALAMAANSTTADVSDFSMALRQGGSVAKLAGLSFNETMVALEALADISVRNSDAGTSMKTAFLQLVGPTKKQKQLAEELNLSFVNQEGRMRSLGDISQQLRDRLSGMGDAQRTATLKTLAGTDGVRTLTALYEAGPEKLKRYSEELSRSGTAAEVARRKQDNLAGDLEKLKGSIETLAITGGGKLTPFLRTAAQEATVFINQIGDGTGVGGQFADTVGRIGTAVGNLGVAIGPTLLSLGQTALSLTQFGAGLLSSQGGVAVLAAALGGLAGRFVALKFGSAIAGMLSLAAAMTTTAGRAGVAQAAMTRLSVAMRANPIGLVATGIGLLAGALIGLSGSQNRASVSARDLADAQNALYDATKRVKDLDLEATDRKLAHRRASITLKNAENDLRNVRKDGNATALQVREAELRVDEARQNVKRTTRELNRTDRDAKQAKDAHTRATEDNRKALAGRIQTLKNQISSEAKSGVEAKLHAGKIAELRAELERTEREYRAAMRLDTSQANAALSAFKQGLASIPRTITTVANLVRTGGGGGGGHASGHKTSGPEVALIGEGGGPEYVIPTEPRYRRRGIGLWQQAARDLGIPGYKAGKGGGRYVPSPREKYRFPLDKVESQQQAAKQKHDNAKQRVKDLERQAKEKVDGKLTGAAKRAQGKLGEARGNLTAAQKELSKQTAIMREARQHAGGIDKAADRAEIARQKMELADKQNKQGKYDAAKKQYLAALRGQRNRLEIAQGLGPRKGSPYWRELEIQIQSLSNDIQTAKGAKSTKAEKAAEPQTLQDMLTKGEKGALAGLSFSEALAATTADTADDASTKAATRDFWQGVYDRLAAKGAPTSVLTEALQQIGAPEDETTKSLTDHLTEAEKATLAGLDLAAAKAGTTADKQDDYDTAMATRGFWQGIASRLEAEGASADVVADAYRQIGAEPENEAAEASKQLAEEIAGMRAEMKRQNDLGQSIMATELATVWRALGDVISGQIGGLTAGRALTASAGSVVRY